METKLAQYDKSLTQTTTCINEHLSRHPSCSCNRSNTRKKIWINTDDWAEQDRQLQEKLKSRKKVDKADDWADRRSLLHEKLEKDRKK